MKTKAITEEEQIKAVCAGMLEAWYGGDGQKMASVLHRDLAKRGIIRDPDTGQTRFAHTGKEAMVEASSKGIGKIPRPDWAIQTTILHQYENLATVEVKSAYLIDICQVAKIDGEWKIVNVLWTPWRTPPWFKRA